MKTQVSGIDDTKSSRLNHCLSLMQRGILVCVVFAVAILSSRLRAIRNNSEINVDESLFMAQSMRYLHDFVPWRSVDGATSGPFNSWPLSLMQLLGIPLNYQNVHLLAALLLLAAVIMMWAALRLLAPPMIAALGGAAATTFVVLAQGADFVHFSSELIPVALCSGAVLLMARGLVCLKTRLWSWSMAAVLLGACPWAKLQALPISAALFAWLVWKTWRPEFRVEAGSSKRVRSLVILSIGFCLTSGVILLVLMRHGVLEEFWNSYIVRSLSYAEGDGLPGLGERIYNLWFRAAASRHILGIQAGATAFMLAWACCGRPGWREASAQQRAFFQLGVVYLLGALVAVLKPAMGFAHYELFLFLPVTLIAGTILTLWHDNANVSRRNSPARFGTRSVFLYLMTMIGFQTVGAGCWLMTPAGTVQAGKITHTGFPGHELAFHIRTHGPDAQALGVWGWAPGLYVETGLMPATRYGICHYLIDPHPLRERFRRNYMEDLKQSRPAVFVDAVAPGCFMWGWDDSLGIESFPALANFIAENYHLVEAVRAARDSKPVRIYELNRTAAGSR